MNKCGSCVYHAGYRFCHGPYKPVPEKDDVACGGFVSKEEVT